MKKLLISILLVFAFVLGGCTGCMGCDTSTTLSFSDAWIKGNEQRIGLTETVSYTVTLDKNLIVGDMSFKEQVDDEKIDYLFTNGKYVVETKIVDASNVKTMVNEDFNSDVLDSIVNSTDQNIDKRVLIISSRFNIDFTFKTNEMTESKTNNDTIESTVVVLRNGDLFSPIFSKTESKQTLVSVGKKVIVEQQHSLDKTVYNKKSVESNVSYFATAQKDGVNVGDLLKQDVKKAKCTYKSVIDNNALLFSLRSVSLDDKTATIPVYTYVYGKTQNLTVSQGTAQADIFSINQGADAEIQLTAYQISLNTTTGCATGTNTGRPQLVFLNTAQETPPASLGSNRTLIMKYVQPLIEYSGYASLGALVYKLDSVSLA